MKESREWRAMDNISLEFLEFSFITMQVFFNCLKSLSRTTRERKRELDAINSIVRTKDRKRLQKDIDFRHMHIIPINVYSRQVIELSFWKTFTWYQLQISCWCYFFGHNIFSCSFLFLFLIFLFCSN